MEPKCFAIIGLILDIVGVVIVYLYGIPPKYDQGYTEMMPQEEYDRTKRKSTIGFVLLLLGFVSQLLSYIITSEE